MSRLSTPRQGVSSAYPWHRTADPRTVDEAFRTAQWATAIHVYRRDRLIDGACWVVVACFLTWLVCWLVVQALAHP